MGKKSRKKKAAARGQLEEEEDSQPWIEYKRLRVKAYVLNAQEEWRSCYDASLQAVLAAPDVWALGRYGMFQSGIYHAMGKQEQFTPSWNIEDKRLLQERFVCNEKEPIAFRVAAASLIFGQTFFSGFDGYDDLLADRLDNMCHYTLELIKRSPPDDAKRVFVERSDSLTVERELQDTAQLVMALLEVRDLLGHTAEDQFPREMNLWGADKCDCCGKAAWRVEGGLQKCRRCEMFYYCSMECHTQDWHNGGHKRSCRKKGCIYVGDVMICRPGTEKLPSLVEIMNEEKPGSWAVAPAGDGPSFTVPKEKLVRIRQDYVKTLSSGQLAASSNPSQLA